MTTRVMNVWNVHNDYFLDESQQNQTWQIEIVTLFKVCFLLERMVSAIRVLKIIHVLRIWLVFAVKKNVLTIYFSTFYKFVASSLNDRY